MEKFEYVIVGSGFGGATVAMRLAEAGKSVLILERGRRWRGKNMPHSSSDNLSSVFPEPGESHFLWGRKLSNPFRQKLGLFDLKQFLPLQSLVSAGVGGGSLIWANVVVKAHEEAFARGWPDGINLSSLEPYYQEAAKFLRPALIPGIPGVEVDLHGQRVARAELHKLAAERLGLPWQPCEVAVNFADVSRAKSNGFGNARQMGCNFCGLCSAGCPQNAKNTVDLTYIARAEAYGAELRPLHELSLLEELNGKYLLRVNRYEIDGRLAERLTIEAENLVLSAGTFGSTEILLRSKRDGYLPHLSPALGSRFSINGNVLSGALNRYSGGDALDTNNGPAVASMIDLGRYVIEDIANPTWAAGMVGGSSLSRAYNFLRLVFGVKMSPEKVASLASDLLVYVGVGLDSASGRMRLNRLGQLTVDWPEIASEPAILAQHRAQRAVAEALGREYVPDLFSTFGRQFSYHPLGGCSMGDDPRNSVLDAFGQVHGYAGLYVADGSMVPTALGRNPSYTICALAERVAERMLEKAKGSGACAASRAFSGLRSS